MTEDQFTAQGQDSTHGNGDAVSDNRADGIVQVAQATGGATNEATASAAPSAGAAPMVIVLDGADISRTVAPDQAIAIQGADIAALTLAQDGQSLVLSFGDSGSVVLEGYFATVDPQAAPTLTVNGVELPIGQLIAQVQEEANLVEPAAGPEADGGPGEPGGGARFDPTVIGSIGEGIDTLGLLGPTALTFGIPDPNPAGSDTLSGLFDISVTTEVVSELPEGSLYPSSGLYEDSQPFKNVGDDTLSRGRLNVVFDSTGSAEASISSFAISGFPEGSALTIEGLPGGESFTIYFGDAPSSSSSSSSSSFSAFAFLFASNPQPPLAEPAEMPPAPSDADLYAPSGALDLIEILSAYFGGPLTEEQFNSLDIFVGGTPFSDVDFALAFDATIEGAGLESSSSFGPFTVVVDAVADQATLELGEGVTFGEDSGGFESEFPQSAFARSALVGEGQGEGSDKACHTDGIPVFAVGFSASVTDPDGSEGITRLVLSINDDIDSEGEGDDPRPLDLYPSEEGIDSAILIIGGTEIAPDSTTSVNIWAEVLDPETGTLTWQMVETQVSFDSATGELSLDFTGIDGRVQRIDLRENGSEGGESPLEIRLPQHSDHDFDLEVAVTTRELRADSESGDQELTFDNNESTAEGTIRVEIEAVADGAIIKIGEYCPCWADPVSADLTNDGALNGIVLTAINFDGSVGEVTYTSNGAGVEGGLEGYPEFTVPDQIGHNDGNGETQSLVATLPQDAACVTFTVSNLYSNESGGEIGIVTLYYDGVAVGTFAFGPADDEAVGSAIEGVDGYIPVIFDSVHTGSVTIDSGDLPAGIVFDEIRFTATDRAIDPEGDDFDSSDYFVKGIDFIPAIEPEVTCESVSKTVVIVEDGRGDPAEHGDNAGEEPGLVVPLLFSAALKDQDGSEAVTKAVVSLEGADENAEIIYLGEDDPEAPGTIVINGVTYAYEVSEDGHTLTITLPEGGENELAPTQPPTVDFSPYFGVQLPIDDSTDFDANIKVTTEEVNPEGGIAVGGESRTTFATIEFEIRGVVGEAATDIGDYNDKDVANEDGSTVHLSEDGHPDPEAHAGADEGPLEIDVKYTASTQDEDADPDNGSEGIASITLAKDESDGTWTYNGEDIAKDQDGTLVTIDGHAAKAVIDENGNLVLTFTNPNDVESVSLSEAIGIKMPVDYSGDFNLTITTTTQEFDDDVGGAVHAATTTKTDTIHFQVDDVADMPTNVTVTSNGEEGNTVSQIVCLSTAGLDSQTVQANWSAADPGVNLRGVVLTPGDGPYVPPTDSADLGGKNVSFTHDGQTWSYNGVGVNADDDIDGGETDTIDGDSANTVEALELTFGTPMDSVTVELAALFDGVVYDAGHPELVRWIAYDSEGKEVDSGNVDSTLNGLASFTAGREEGEGAISTLVIHPVTNDAGDNGNNSDFLIRSVKGVTVGTECGCDDDARVVEEGNTVTLTASAAFSDLNTLTDTSEQHFIVIKLPKGEWNQSGFTVTATDGGAEINDFTIVGAGDLNTHEADKFEPGQYLRIQVDNQLDGTDTASVTVEFTAPDMGSSKDLQFKVYGEAYEHSDSPDTSDTNDRAFSEAGECLTIVIDDVPTLEAKQAICLYEGEEQEDGNVLTNAVSGDGGLTVTDVDGVDVLPGDYTQIDGQYGTLRVWSDGRYVYTSDPSVDHSDDRSLSENFSFTIVDCNGTVVTQDLTVTVKDLGPTLGAAETAAVDEDDLVPDGTDNDPESLSTGGDLNVDWGPDDGAGRTLAFTEDGQPTGLTSNGESVTIAVSDDGLTLTGKAGGETIFTVTLNDAGNGSYDFDLSGPLDHADGGGENTLDLAFQFKAIDSDDSHSAPGSFIVKVTDDIPEAGDIDPPCLNLDVQTTNVVLAVDLTGSMTKIPQEDGTDLNGPDQFSNWTYPADPNSGAYASGKLTFDSTKINLPMTAADRIIVGGPEAGEPTRLELMKLAIDAMVTEYEESGQTVTLTLVGYSNSGNEGVDDATNYGPIGAGTFTIPADIVALRAAIDTMESGFNLGGPAGGTSYADGLQAIIDSNLTADPDANNQIFFFSDGEPNGSNPLPTQQQIDDVNGLGFDVTTIGISLDGGGSALVGLADDLGGDYENVDDPNELAALLETEVNTSATTGNILEGPDFVGGVGHDFGADGPGGLHSITIGGTVYTPESDEVVDGILTVLTPDEATFTLNFETGEYEYRVSNDSTGDGENFTFTIIDDDGDTAEGTLDLCVTPVEVETPIVTIGLEGDALCIDEDGNGSFTVTAATAVGASGDTLSEVKLPQLQALKDAGWTVAVDDGSGIDRFDETTGIYTPADNTQTVTLTVTLSPPDDSDEDVWTEVGSDITVTATATDGSATADSAPATIDVNVDAVADAPTLDLGPATGVTGIEDGGPASCQVKATEGTVFQLPIVASLTDTDGSEDLDRVTVSMGENAPDGAVFTWNGKAITSADVTDGIYTFTLNNDGSVTITLDDAGHPQGFDNATVTGGGLGILLPPNANTGDGSFDVTVKAWSQETNTGDEECDTDDNAAVSATGTIAVTVTPASDRPEADDVVTESDPLSGLAAIAATLGITDLGSIALFKQLDVSTGETEIGDTDPGAYAGSGDRADLGGFDLEDLGNVSFHITSAPSYGTLYIVDGSNNLLATIPAGTTPPANFFDAAATVYWAATVDEVVDIATGDPTPVTSVPGSLGGLTLTAEGLDGEPADWTSNAGLGFGVDSDQGEHDSTKQIDAADEDGQPNEALIATFPNAQTEISFVVKPFNPGEKGRYTLLDQSGNPIDGSTIEFSDEGGNSSQTIVVDPGVSFWGIRIEAVASDDTNGNNSDKFAVEEISWTSQGEGKDLPPVSFDYVTKDEADCVSDGATVVIEPGEIRLYPEPEAGDEAAVVTEADLSDGTGDDPASADTTGTLAGAEGDNVISNVTFTSGPGGTPTLDDSGDQFVLSNDLWELAVDKDDGEYTFTLKDNAAHTDDNAAFGGDQLPVEFSYTAENPAGQTDIGSLTVDINDDRPVATNDAPACVTESGGEPLNVVITIDASGSMFYQIDPATGEYTDPGNPDYGTPNRMEYLQASVIDLLNAYEATGETVNVKFVTFAEWASSPSGVYDLSDPAQFQAAKDLVNDIDSDGLGNNTDYEAALDGSKEAIEDFTDDPAYSENDTKFYFFSDGQPTDGETDQPFDHPDWETWLADRNVVSEAVGIKLNDPDGDLDFIDNTADGPIYNDSIGDLTDDILSTLTPSLTGNVLIDGVDDEFGADGEGAPAIVSLQYVDEGGITRTAEPSGGDTEITVTTQHGGRLTFDFANGDYSYIAPNVSDDVTESFTYKIEDGDGDTSTATLDICVKDGVPAAVDDTETVTEGGGTAIDYNLTLVLDLSGSMDYDASGTNQTRIQVAVQALKDLLDAYDGLSGDVTVNLVTFQGNDAEVRGTNLTDIAAVKATLEGFLDDADGGTPYDEAIEKVMEDVFTDPSYPQASATQKNLVYFLSDGKPSDDHDYVYDDDRTAWEQALQNHGAEAIAIGAGSGDDLNEDQLNAVAYPGEAILVEDFSQLIDQIVGTVPVDPATGNLLANDTAGSDGFAAEAITQIEYDGNPYTDTDSDGEIVITTTIGGELKVNVETGDYTYTPPDDVTSDVTETFTYTVKDGDGDTATANLTITVENNEPPTATNDTIITNIVDGSEIVVPDWVLTRNDNDPNGDALTVDEVSGATGGTASEGSGTVTFAPDVEPRDFQTGDLETEGDDEGGLFWPSNDKKSNAQTLERDRFRYEATESAAIAAILIDGYVDGEGGFLDWSEDHNDWYKVDLKADEKLIIDELDGFGYSVAVKGPTGPAAPYSGPIEASNDGTYYIRIQPEGDAETSYQLKVTIDASALDNGFTGNFDYTASDGLGSDTANVTVVGQNGDTITGDGENNILVGGDGDDILLGNGGDDILIGGLGRDELTGGAGEDIFVIGRDAFDQIVNDGGLPDLITDYGNGGDAIDLRELFGEDAVADMTGNPANIGNYIKLTDTGELQVDTDGQGGNFVTVATFADGAAPSSVDVYVDDSGNKLDIP